MSWALTQDALKPEDPQQLLLQMRVERHGGWAAFALRRNTTNNGMCDTKAVIATTSTSANVAGGANATLYVAAHYLNCTGADSYALPFAGGVDAQFLRSASVTGVAGTMGVNGSLVMTVTRGLSVASDALEPAVDLERGNDVLFAYASEKYAAKDPFALSYHHKNAGSVRIGWKLPGIAYPYSQSLAPGGRLTLSWALFNKNTEMAFKLQLKGQGWLAFGLTKQSPPRMCDNNVMMATSSGRLGRGGALYAAAHLVNCTAWGTPQMATDIANDVVDGYAVTGSAFVVADAVANTTTLFWRRLLNPCTCGDAAEPQIDPFVPSGVLWAFGTSPDFALGYHDKNAGFATVEWLPDAHVKFFVAGCVCLRV